MARRLKSLLHTILSFESLFVLYLYAGKYKNDPRLSWFPVDITVFFLVLSIVSGVWVIYKRGGVFRRNALFLTFAFASFLAYASLSYLWSHSEIYAVEKVGYLTVLTFWPFLACTHIIGYRLSRFKRFAVILTILSLWFIFESLFAFLKTSFSGHGIDLLGITYLGVGRVIGPASLVVLVYGTILEKRVWLRVVSMLLFGVMIAVLLVLGGRGPLIATLLPSLLLFYNGIDIDLHSGVIRIKRFIWPIAFMTISVFIPIVLFVSDKVFATINRLLMLFESLGSSAEKRIDMYGKALQVWASDPIFGSGIGSWPVLAGFGDIKMYPHNIILEVLAEFGLVGLVLFSVPLLYSLVYVATNSKLMYNYWPLIGLMLFLNASINAMFTGDLPGNRYFFAFMGFLVARWVTKDNHSSF
jgi:O-antigen ligase